MSWACGTNGAGRDVGYGVPAICDHPQCSTRIDRGFGYACGGEHDGGERGCGLYFCRHHMRGIELCTRCHHRRSPFRAKPDITRWIVHKLTHPSWAAWRAENPTEALRLKGHLVEQIGERNTELLINNPPQEGEE